MVLLQVLKKDCIAKIMYSSVTNYDELLRVVNTHTLFCVFGVINMHTPYTIDTHTNQLPCVGKPNPACHSLQATGKLK